MPPAPHSPASPKLPKGRASGCAPPTSSGTKAAVRQQSGSTDDPSRRAERPAVAAKSPAARPRCANLGETDVPALSAHDASADQPSNGGRHRRRSRRLGLRLAARRRDPQLLPSTPPATGARRDRSLASCSASNSAPPPASTATENLYRDGGHRRAPSAGLQLQARLGLNLRGTFADLPRRCPRGGRAGERPITRASPATSAMLSPPASRTSRRARLPARLFRQPGNPASGLDSAGAWAVNCLGCGGSTRRRGRRCCGWRAGAGASASCREPVGPVKTLGRRRRRGPRGRSPALLALGDQDRARTRADRRVALHLLADLRRAATPAGTLPERVDAQTGVPRSTTLWLSNTTSQGRKNMAFFFSLHRGDICATILFPMAA